MRSFATVAAAAAAALSTASAFVPQAQKNPIGHVVSVPVTSNVVLGQAAEEADPADFTPEVRMGSPLVPYFLFIACLVNCLYARGL